MRRVDFRLIPAAVLTSLPLCPGIASAQRADQGPLETVVVTAQRREQALQDVPISVAALSAETLRNSGITTTQDLSIVTPGLAMNNLRNAVTPYMRGVGTQSGTNEQSIAVYVDNVYYASPAAAVFSFNNIERVEVLKGPQGTLFGRNSTGGLIHIITRDPSHTPEAKLTTGYGNFDTWSGNVYATGGLSESVAADIAVSGSTQGDGWGENIVLGNDVSLKREWAARSKLKADFGESTTATLSTDYNHWKSDFGNTRQVPPGFVAIGGVTQIGSIYDFNSRSPGGAIYGSYQYGASLKIQHAFSDTLSLQSTSAYREHKIRSYTDSDGVPATLSEALFQERGDTLQQEFLFNGANGPVAWTAGTFLFRYDYGMQPTTVFSSPGSPANARRYTRVLVHSYAGFAQGTYSFTDSTNLTLGARYTTEDADAFGRFTATAGNPAPVGTVVFTTETPGLREQTEREWSKATWRAALDHRFSKALMAYVSGSRGFKSGSYNNFAIGDPPVDPEVLDAYELGIKSNWFDGILQVNLAGFYYDYADIQLSTVVAVGTRDTNAANAEIYGADMDFVLVPPVGAGRLEIRGGVTVLDTEYVRYPGAVVNIPRDPAVPPFGGNITLPLTDPAADASGKDMIRAPKFSSTLGFDYSVPIGSALQAGINVNWQYMGKYYWDAVNLFPNDAYNLVNAQLSLGSDNNRWRVRLWGRNLGDTEYFTSVTPTGLSTTAVPAAPRTYGVAFDVNFGG